MFYGLHLRVFLHVGGPVCYIEEEELYLLQEQYATHSLDDVVFREHGVQRTGH